MIDFIVCGAGNSTRFGENKLLMELNGIPVILRAVNAVKQRAGKIFVTVRECDVDEYKKVLDGTGATLVVGGETRAQSVLNALKLCTGEFVAVHDGARPYLKEDLLARLIGKAEEKGSAIPVLPVTDTIKVLNGGAVQSTPERKTLFAVQTPQIFRRDELLKAYGAVNIKSATDDASVMEMAGYKVFTVEGDRNNVKITYKDDIKQMDIRTGIGYDAHRLVAGRKLMLGTVEVPYEKGLLGHSDADVVAHAICDSMLSACGLRDIGYYFPDSAKDTEGMSGREILKRTAELVKNAGFTPSNVSCVLVAQAPKIAPYIEKMNEGVACALGIDKANVSISATTTEKMGFEGTGEGMSAQAVTTVERE